MAESMRALVYHGAGDVRVEQRPVPSPGPGQVLLRVTAVGVCGTDAHEVDTGPHMFPTPDAPHYASGHQGPMIMGHEFAGRVEALGAGVTAFREGELLVCGAGVSCGECVHCRRGRTNLCESYWTLGLNADGGLAEFVVAPADICFSAEPYKLSDHLAGITQPLAIAVHAARRARLTPEDQVVIIGAGGIGAFLVQAVAAVTSHLAVIDLSEERLELARLGGAAHTHDASGGVDAPALKREWGLNPTVVFEVTGTPRGLESAYQWMERGSRLVLVGLQDGELPLNHRTTSLIEHELIGTNAHVAKEDFPAALEILARGGSVWQKIAPEVVPLEDAVSEGLIPLIEGRATRIKTLIDPRVSAIDSSSMTLAV